MPPEIVIPGGAPRHQRQLQTGSPTRSTDCGPVTTMVAVEYALHGAITPIGPEREEFIAFLRRQMTHLPFWPATNLRNSEEAIEGVLTAGQYMLRGFVHPGRMFKHWPGSHDVVERALRREKYVVLGVSYRAVNNLMPHLSGSPTFMGGHWVGLVGLEEDDAGVWTRLYDPLHDGRRSGIPTGPVTIRLHRYLRAAEAFGSPKPAGNGRAIFGTVGRQPHKQ